MQKRQQINEKVETASAAPACQMNDPPAKSIRSEHLVGTYGLSPYAFCIVVPFAFRYSERSSLFRSKIDDGLLAPAASKNAHKFAVWNFLKMYVILIIFGKKCEDKCTATGIYESVWWLEGEGLHYARCLHFQTAQYPQICLLQVVSLWILVAHNEEPECVSSWDCWLGLYYIWLKRKSVQIYWTVTYTVSFINVMFSITFTHTMLCWPGSIGVRNGSVNSAWHRLSSAILYCVIRQLGIGYFPL